MEAGSGAGNDRHPGGGPRKNPYVFTYGRHHDQLTKSRDNHKKRTEACTNTSSEGRVDTWEGEMPGGEGRGVLFGLLQNKHPPGKTTHANYALLVIDL
jgi:hypothetical protein